LSHPISNPNEIVTLIDGSLDKILDKKAKYRLTGVVLAGLVSNEDKQSDLFGSVLKTKGISKIYEAIDGIDKKFGKHTVFIGSSFRAITGKQYGGERSEDTDRKQNLFKGENKRQRVGIPMMGDVN